MKEWKEIKILAVDDESGVLKTLTSIFENDYNISIESDPRLAADLIRKEQFDLFLIDYQMPVMNGIQLLEEIKEVYENSDYAAVLCTASGTTYLFQQEYNQRLFSYFVEKPFNVSHLKSVVSQAAENLLSRQEVKKGFRIFDEVYSF